MSTFEFGLLIAVFACGGKPPNWMVSLALCGAACAGFADEPIRHVPTRGEQDFFSDAQRPVMAEDSDSLDPPTTTELQLYRLPVDDGGGKRSTSRLQKVRIGQSFKLLYLRWWLNVEKKSVELPGLLNVESR